MGLETATYISDLNSSNPLGSDGKNAGDDHLRLIKSTLLATFPNVTGAVTLTHTQVNKAVYLDGSNTVSMVFYVGTAPTGWTQNTTLSGLDGATLRCETSTGGGSVGGTHDVASPPTTSHTHTTTGSTGSESSHTHSVSGNTGTPTGGSGTVEGGVGFDLNSNHYHAISFTSGAGSSHQHTNGTITAVANGPTAFAPKYINVILCSKN